MTLTEVSVIGCDRCLFLVFTGTLFVAFLLSCVSCLLFFSRFSLFPLSLSLSLASSA